MIFPLRTILQLVLLLWTQLSVVQAWGEDGHEIVGNLAYHLLPNKTKAVVDQILGVGNENFFLRGGRQSNHDKDDNTPLGAIANWADEVRHSTEYHWSTPLHYIDIHDNAVEGGCPVFDQTPEQTKKCHFDYNRDCMGDVCVAGAIVNYTNHLKGAHPKMFAKQDSQGLISRSLKGSASMMIAPWLNFYNYMPQEEKEPTKEESLVKQSLMFLTHFIGDIHQPLHSARTTDRGGNTIFVTFDHGNSNNALDSSHKLELHAVWDTTMIERAIHTSYGGKRVALETELLQYIHDADDATYKQWLACADSSKPLCTTIWAEQSWQQALQWAYKNSDNQTEVVSGTHLTDDYYETRMPQIKLYLAMAGVRLAVALEYIFK